MTEHRTAENLDREQHVDLTTDDGAKRVLAIGFDDLNNEHKVLQTTPDGVLKTQATNPIALSAFGEVLVSAINPLVQIQFPYNINTRIVTPTEVGSGTVTQVDSMAVIGTGTTTASTALMESNIVVKYNPGQGGVCKFTALYTTGVIGTIQEVGLGDVDDGLFIGFNGDEFSINRRNTGTNNFVSQSDFNQDKLDGTGGSRMTIDPTKFNVFKIQFQWLGAGNIFFNVENPATGRFFCFHQINYANNFTIPSLGNPTFPLRVFTDNGATTSDIITKTGSMGGFSEGRVTEDGPVNFSETFDETVTTSLLPVISIRNKAVYQSKTNKVRIKILEISIVNTGNRQLAARITLDGVLVGDSFTDINTNTSVVEEDFAATSISGGIDLGSFFVAAGESKEFVLTDDDVKLNPGNTLSIVALTSSSTTTADFNILWKELF